MLQLIATLLGEGGTPILDRQLAQFVRRVEEDLIDLMWQIEARGLNGADSLLAMTSTLNEEQRLNLSLSPEFYHALRGARDALSADSFQQLHSAISNCLHEDHESEEGQAETSRPTAIVGETIRVDLDTDQVRRSDPTSPVFFRPFEILAPEEAERVVAKLERAMSEIDDAAPTFGRLVRNYTRRIYVRKADGEAPASEQVDAELGAIRLRNVHSDDYPHDQIMDDLIHESVHNYLGTFEYVNFPFIRFGGINDRSSARPVSPWSLRPIQMLPFLHAAFVYFAIANFAKRRLAALPQNDSRTVHLIAQYNRYTSGFLYPGRLSQYAAGQADVDPRVLAALDWMQDSVRRDVSLARRASFIMEQKEPANEIRQHEAA